MLVPSLPLALLLLRPDASAEPSSVTYLAPAAAGRVLPVMAVPPPPLGGFRAGFGGAVTAFAPARAPAPVDAPAPAPDPAPTPDAPDPLGLPEGEDVPLEELEDEPPPDDTAKKPPADPDAEPDPGDASTSKTKTETDPDLSIDNVFGTEETHTEVSDKAGEGGKKRKPGVTKFLSALETRVRVLSSVYFDVEGVEQRGFGRNENRLEFYFAYTPNKHVQIVGDVEAVFFGRPPAKELDDLATRQMLEPFHFESDAAYVALTDLLPHLDIKVGRQIVVWGSADKFNPTNNINPDDLEDRTLFTEPIANQMVVVDYAPLEDKLWFQGVYVPLFYPALLPPSAADALGDPNATVPYANDEDLAKVERLQEIIAIPPMRLTPEVFGHVKIPRPTFTNGQSAIKMGTSLGGVDMTVSYYNGRHDIPTPILAESSNKPEEEQGPDGPGCCVTSDVTLIYPRMQVIGADFTTQLPFLKNMGLWGEGALFFPQANELEIEFPIAVDVTPDDGITNPVNGMVGPTIRSTPYIKATAGFDYTFGKHVYVQLQYLRGFIDEFGADHIGNYLVGGSDLIFFGRHLVFRLFGVVDLPTGKGDPGSYVIYPELILTPPWGSITFDIGSFVLLGKENTKFGQKAAGSSIVFFKVIGAF